MVKLIYRSVLMAGLVWFLSANGHAQSGEMPMRPQRLLLGDMRAMLFFENTGKFSPDVFTNQVNLWNTPIEGASRCGFVFLRDPGVTLATLAYPRLSSITAPP